jgi:acetyl esterase/lipase
VRLTGYLEHLLKQEMPHRLTIITPSDPARRGAQLSLIFDVDVDAAAAKLASAGVICDVRRPNVIRVAPAPFYNSFTDVYEFVKILKNVFLERQVERVTYGSSASQFFDLSVPGRSWLPDKPLPVAVIVHGGFWKSKYGIHNSAIDNLAPYLVNERMATVELEYRRVSPDNSLGEDEGGWERTKDDILVALNKLNSIASSGLHQVYKLDMTRVVFIGHSAGGQLVSWLCSSKSGASLPFKPAVCVPLAPVCDLLEATRRRLVFIMHHIVGIVVLLNA